VIWLADHGDAVASHGGLWDKSSTFIEEVVRVPMAIRWPAEIDGGQRTDHLVSNMDATATMLDAAGINVPDYMHSRSVLPLGRDGEDDQWSDELICEHMGHGGHLYPMRMILRDRYKFVYSLHDMNELYDLEDDPFELNNLVHDPQYADLLADFKVRLVQHLEGSDMRNQRMKQLFLVALKYDR
jgi:arylsulfatase A-like enzyme